MKITVPAVSISVANSPSELKKVPLKRSTWWSAPSNNLLGLYIITALGRQDIFTRSEDVKHITHILQSIQSKAFCL